MSILVGAATLEEAARGVLSAMGGGLGFAAGVFWIEDTTGQEALRPLTWWSAAGCSTPELERAAGGALPRLGKRVAGLVGSDGAPRWVDNPPSALAAGSGAGGLTDGLGMALLVPVVAAGRVRGVVELLGPDGSPPDHQLAGTLTALGGQIGQYVERLRAEAAERHQIEAALRASEVKMLRLYQSDVIGIVFSDTRGGVREANDAFLRMIGYSREDLISGKIRWREMTPPEWLPADDRAIEHLAISGTAPTYEKEYWRHDGARIPVLIGGALLDRAAGDVLCFVLDNTPRKDAERTLAELNRELEDRVRARTASLQQSELRAERSADALALSEKQLRALAAHLQTIREDERPQLAPEIHDVLGQEITGLKMDLAWLARRLEGRASAPHSSHDERPRELLDRLEAMRRAIDATIVTVRRIATDLRPGLLDDLGLVPALEWQARQFERRSGLSVVFTGPYDELAVDRPVATAVFRIFQELLTNVARHAAASTVEVSLRSHGDRLVLEVADDGRGIAQQDCAGGSLGLLGIRERALAVGGSFTIAGASGQGTSARVEVPVRNDP